MVARLEKAAETINEDFPLVELNLLTFAERPKPGEEDKILFYNPRREASFDEASMQSLLESILEDGLQQPPIIRILNRDGAVFPGLGEDKARKQIYQVVAGERRTRCLLKAYDQNLMIFDQKTGEKRPAQEVIEKIPCKVLVNCSDEKALRIAFVENSKHKPLSSLEEIELAERLARIYKKQEDICRVMGTNPTWVSQTLSFRSELPEDAFNKFTSGLLSRYVAVQLLSLKPEDRQVTFDQMIKEEEAEYQAAIEQEQEELEQADLAVEIHEAEEELAADPQTFEKATKAKKKAQKKLDKVKGKLEKTIQNAGKIGQGHFEKATGKLNVVPRTPKMLGKVQVEQFFVNMVENWIEDGKKDPIVKEEIPTEYLKIIKKTALAILSGQRDPSKIIREFMFEEGLWENDEDQTAVVEEELEDDDNEFADDDDEEMVFNEDVEGHFAVTDDEEDDDLDE